MKNEMAGMPFILGMGVSGATSQKVFLLVVSNGARCV
jgi:hypothetical protein